MEKGTHKYQGIVGGLAAKVREALTPLITSDYVLLDCPYHYNTGDSLIWQGELDFLESLPFRMLGHSSVFTYNRRRVIDPSTLILLHGGGNFGDLWRRHSEFRLSIAEAYPQNRIIVLPQTVWYSDRDTMRADAEAFARHPNLTICARDARSYELLKENFDNEALLVPDMAFCIDMERYAADVCDDPQGQLYLRREDRELDTASENIPAGADVRDWPSSVRFSRTGLTFRLLRGAAIAFGMSRRPGAAYDRACAATDNFALTRFLPHAISAGVEFVSSYDHITTTRLHGAILSMLVGRPFTLVDNNYGKLSTFFDTWSVARRQRSHGDNEIALSSTRT